MDTTIHDVGRRVVRDTFAAQLAPIIASIAGGGFEGRATLDLHDVADDVIEQTAGFFGDTARLVGENSPDGAFLHYHVEIDTALSLNLYGRRLRPSAPLTDAEAAAETLVSGFAT